MNLPDKLTVFRIYVVPIFILVVGLPLDWGQPSIGDTTLAVIQLVGAVIFASANITNWLDGKIAHARGLVTDFGKFAGPLADKMLIMTAFIMLVDQGKAPGWIIAIIVCRELVVTGLRLLLVEHGEVMAATWPGKIETATQMVATILLFINNIPFNLISTPADRIMLYTYLIFTIYSGADYFIRNSGVFKGSMQVLFCGRPDSSVLDKVKMI